MEYGAPAGDVLVHPKPLTQHPGLALCREAFLKGFPGAPCEDAASMLGCFCIPGHLLRLHDLRCTVLYTREALLGCPEFLMFLLGFVLKLSLASHVIILESGRVLCSFVSWFPVPLGKRTFLTDFDSTAPSLVPEGSSWPQQAAWQFPFHGQRSSPMYVACLVGPGQLAALWDSSLIPWF